MLTLKGLSCNWQKSAKGRKTVLFSFNNVGGADCGLGWSGSGEGVMATFNPLVTVGFEFQLLPGWRNFKLKLQCKALNMVNRGG
jgi:hypothetical protein